MVHISLQKPAILLNFKTVMQHMGSKDGSSASTKANKIISKHDQPKQDGPFSTNLVEIFYNKPPSGNLYLKKEKIFIKS